MGTFLRRISAFLFFLLALALVSSACTITIGPYEDAEGTGPQSTPALPAPTNGAADEMPLDEAQQARKEETERYTRDIIYKGGEIIAAVELPSGDVLDFIKRDTLPGLPYELPPLPFTAEDFVLPSGVELGLTELEQTPELLELAATATPFKRPMFWPYILGETDATSIEDYLARYQEGGQPSSSRRLYAGLDSAKPNHGVLGTMNQFRPEVAPDSFSLIEFTVYCPADGPVQEQIGIVISVDKRNFFGVNRQKHLDGEPRLHIEYSRLVNGKVRYNWDEVDGAFVGNPFRTHHPGQKVPVSAVGGTQREHLIAIFQVPVTGDWWITYNGEWLGYYPASLFMMLNGGACGSAWYGEVLNIKSDAVKTEMGSGKFVEAGLLNAAYVRNPMYIDLSWTPVEPQEDWAVTPYAPLCYDRSILWEHYIFLGGPGGKNPACQWP
jgi:hypothetical protein